MERRVPVWLLLLTVLLGLVFTVLFGWAVRGVATGDNRLGVVGEMAASVAAFPSLAVTVAEDVRVDTVDTDQPIRVPRPAVDLASYSPVETVPGWDLDGVYVRADRQRLDQSPAWRILVGAFSIGGSMQNAALALSPDLRVEHVWPLFELPILDAVPRAAHRKFIHGFDVLRDGSVVFAFDGGISLQRVGACGQRIWAVAGEFHHAVTLDEAEEYVWTLTDFTLVKVATANGAIAADVAIVDLIAANPEIDVLAIRQMDDHDLGGNGRNTPDRWYNDPLHLNDVDPLPESLAALYPDFEAGDLIVSARALNLIFVFDPETLKIKWWRVGAARRQHDPDWGLSGEITLFDNRLGRDYSRIVAIDPSTFATRTLYSGAQNDFYSRIRGKHQISSNGNLLITSSQQGRLIELDNEQRVVLDVVNTKPGTDDASFVLSEVISLPASDYDFSKEALACAH